MLVGWLACLFCLSIVLRTEARARSRVGPECGARVRIERRCDGTR